MKLINPVGRSLASGIAELAPRACMCSEETALHPSDFTSARGTSDSCLHCGCECSNNENYSSGNRSGAITSIWKS